MSALIELWRDVPGWEPFLEVSNLARVRTKRRVTQYEKRGKSVAGTIPAKVLSPFKANNGYLTVAIKMGKKRPKLTVHRLIASAFVPGFEKGLTVNHIDGVKANNLPENLEWISLAANTAHQWKIGLADLRGENHPSHKLTARKVRIIRQALAKGVPMMHLAILAGVSPSTIEHIREGRRWASV